MSTELSPRNFLRETIALKVETESAFLELGARLYKIHNEEIWKGEYETYEMFLLETRISKATASKLENIHHTFVLTHKVSPKKLAAVGWSSLYSMAKYVDSKEKAEDLVHEATLLTRYDFQAKLKNQSGEQDRCKHEMVKMEFCTKCGIKHRLYD